MHLPVQCGSDRLLVEMNRHYTIEHYLELIEYARKKVPGITFSSDIIVGFPGETEEDFQQTLSLVRKVGYMQLFTFIYSKRTGTKAAEMHAVPVRRQGDGSFTKRNEMLIKLMNGIGDMNLGNYQDNTIDAFGDAYEFLMGMYASNAGKSGGEYYTPQEVSELLTRLTIVGKTEVNKVYDPACGSGSLLLKFSKILGKDNVRLGFFGQEINITTYNLCRINMFLHDIDYDKFDIAHGDTLTDPKHFDDEPFEAIVSNPPYSIKWVGEDDATLINDPRFSPAGVLAPKSKADMAFIMHSLSWLATNGTAAIVCFPGIMYRGGKEQKIRSYLVGNNFVDCVIQLPDNLFYGTSIATCIMVLKKSKKDNSTLFIDASKECIKITNNNKLTDENINNIVRIFSDRNDIQYVSRLVPNKEIAENNYNLSVSQYVEQEDKKEVIDIKALNAELERIVAREDELRKQINQIIQNIESD